MHADQVDVDGGLVRRLLRAQFPDWADLRIERFGSAGTVNAIYRLGDELYVRLPIAAAWAASLKNEGKWLPKLGPHLPVAVPEIVGKGAPGEGYPFHWAVVRWLQGEVWSADAIRDEREAAIDLARFVRALHAIDTRGAPSATGLATLTLRDIDQWVRDSTEKARDLIDADALLAEWETALELPDFEGPSVWIHADLSADNVLVRNGRLSAVIDWGSVHVGDAAHDVAGVWDMLSAKGRRVFCDELSVDDATWARARGWALRAVGGIDYYRQTNPEFAARSIAQIREVLSEQT